MTHWWYSSPLVFSSVSLHGTSSLQCCLCVHLCLGPRSYRSGSLSDECNQAKIACCKLATHQRLWHCLAGCSAELLGSGLQRSYPQQQPWMIWLCHARFLQKPSTHPPPSFCYIFSSQTYFHQSPPLFQALQWQLGGQGSIGHRHPYKNWTSQPSLSPMPQSL